MTAIIERMPAGLPGEVTRMAQSTLEPAIVGDTDIAHGAPVKMVSGKLAPLEAADTAADVYGFLARSFPCQGGTGTLTPGVAPAGTAVSVMRRGYMLVQLASGSAAKNGTVYVRIAVDTGKAVGDIEAALVADNTVALGAQFMGEADASGSVEISYNI
ncbi:MAG: hypothetical protein AB7D51_01755 [Desulfovibrionaceae bacterium]|jgi:hypothetical protein